MIPHGKTDFEAIARRTSSLLVAPCWWRRACDVGASTDEQCAKRSVRRQVRGSTISSCLRPFYVSQNKTGASATLKDGGIMTSEVALTPCYNTRQMNASKPI